MPTIEQIELLLSEATPGPWYAKHESNQQWCIYEKSKSEDQQFDLVDWVKQADAALIASAPTIIRQLLDVAKAAKHLTDYIAEFEEIDGDFFNDVCNALSAIESTEKR